MAIKRIVSTDFWTDNKVVDMFSPEDKLFMLYLLTNPHTTQLGIYKLNTKIAAFEIGYSQEAVSVLLDRFEKKYDLIRYSKTSQEVAVKNYLKHSIVKGGKPVLDLLKRELSQVEDYSLADYVFKELENMPNLNLTVIELKDFYNSNENDNDNDNDNEDSFLVSERIVQPDYREIKKEMLANKKSNTVVQKCEWRGCETKTLQKHHYPIPKRDGGTETVNICYDCHHDFHKTEWDMKNNEHTSTKKQCEARLQEIGIVNDVVREYNRICKSLPEVRAVTDKRKKAVKARWKENDKSLDFFISYFHRVEASDFLAGRSGKGWKANFDWVMNPSNMTKVLEGNYDNREQHLPNGNNAKNDVLGSVNAILAEMRKSDEQRSGNCENSGDDVWGFWARQ